MSKKDGFTLIELLAVIVILALIAVIVAPMVLNTISNSRKSGFASSLKGIKDAIENDYGQSDFEDDNRNYEYKKGVLYNSSGEVVPMSGGISDGYGTGFVDEKGNVKVRIYNTKYCGTMGVENNVGATVTDCDGLDACKQACGL